MKKIILIVISIIFVLIFAFSIYTNKEKIINYLDNKEWEIAETIGKISLNNYYDVVGTLSNVIVVGNNYIKGYSYDGKENFDEAISIRETVIDEAGDYCIIGEKDSSKIYMINANAKLWESAVNGNVLDVSVNKNGYASVIYKQARIQIGCKNYKARWYRNIY